MVAGTSLEIYCKGWKLC